MAADSSINSDTVRVQEVEIADDSEVEINENGTSSYEDSENKPRPMKLFIVTIVVIVIITALIIIGLTGRTNNGGGGDGGNGDNGGNGGNGGSANHPPVARLRIISAPYQEFVINDPIEFDATTSYDKDGDNLTYQWDFDASNGIAVDSTEGRVSHSYELPGNFTITLRVSDGKNESDANKTITVLDKVKIEFDSSGVQRPLQGKEFVLQVTKATRLLFLNELYFTLKDIETGSQLSNGTVQNITNQPQLDIHFIDIDMNNRLSLNDSFVIKENSGADVGDQFELYQILSSEIMEKIGEATLVLTFPV